MTKPMDLFYLSFATNAGFLGATVVEAADEEGAFAEACRRGLNPGGEVAIWGPIPPDDDARAMMGRIVGEAELRADGAVKLKEMDHDLADEIDAAAVIVCADCNKKT